MEKFKDKVLKVVKSIPKGEVLTYKRVAELAGSPRAWRAVGNILNKNKNPRIPCHRVIRSDGKVGGYNKGTKKKVFLLRKEGFLP
jgi:O-6-methylguanine DNA methyltransferase